MHTQEMPALAYKLMSTTGLTLVDAVVGTVGKGLLILLHSPDDAAADLPRAASDACSAVPQSTACGCCQCGWLRLSKKMLSQYCCQLHYHNDL